MPVEFIDKKGFRRLRFVRNTSYNGSDYGPDYTQQECDVENRFAYQFISQGRAVEVKSEPPAVAGGPEVDGQVQTRDPQPENRDPQIQPGLDTSKVPAVIRPARARKKKSS